MGDDKPVVKEGQFGSAFYTYSGTSWWQVPHDQCSNWREANRPQHGEYAPFDHILSGDNNHFPNIEIPDGTVVRVTVRVTKVGSGEGLHRWSDDLDEEDLEIMEIDSRYDG